MKLRWAVRLYKTTVATLFSGFALGQISLTGRVIADKIATAEEISKARWLFELADRSANVLILMGIFLMIFLAAQFRNRPELRAAVIDERTEANGYHSAGFALMVVIVLEYAMSVISLHTKLLTGDLVAQLTISIAILAFVGRYLWLQRR